MAKRLDFSQWQTLIQTFQQSEQNVRQFCTQQQISPSTFYKWRRLVEDHALEQPFHSALKANTKTKTNPHHKTHTNPPNKNQLIQLNQFAQPVQASASLTQHNDDPTQTSNPQCNDDVRWQITLKLGNGIELQLDQL